MKCEQNVNKLGLTQEEQRNLQLIADQGFLFRELVKAIPDHITKKYESYYGHRGARAMTSGMVNRFCGITLAIMKGYSAEERSAYLKAKRAERNA